MLSWYKWPILCIVAELRMEIWTLGCQEWGWYRQNCFSRATVFYIFMKSKWKNVWFFWVVKEKNRKIPVSMYFAFTPAMICEYMPQGHLNAKKKKMCEWVILPVFFTDVLWWRFKCRNIICPFILPGSTLPFCLWELLPFLCQILLVVFHVRDTFVSKLLARPQRPGWGVIISVSSYIFLETFKISPLGSACSINSR